ncbi:MAG: energy transducer TonB [Gammaproteobacteria bacterium]
MTEAAYPGPFSPESPAQRLPWILLIAVLLVLLGLVGLGKVLKTPVRPTAKPKPLKARIYELPASRGAAPAKPAHHAPSHSSSHPTNAHRSAPQHSQRAEHAQRRAQSATSHVSAKKGAALARTSHPHRKAPAHPVPQAHPAKPRPQHTIHWAVLQSQINTAVRQSDSALPQVHDPHTLVARYYIASLLSKLQRIGDMNYPTDLTGVPVLKLVVGTHGELLHLTLLHSSGNGTLDHDALQIARESAPFAPFPDRLKHQTSHVELVCYMSFDGYRQMYTGY